MKVFKQRRIGDIQMQFYPKLFTVTHCPKDLIFKIGLIPNQKVIDNLDGIIEIVFGYINDTVVLMWKASML